MERVGTRMRDLVIIGAGGFAREAAWLVEEINLQKRTWNLLGYLDDDVDKWGRELSGYPVLGDLEKLDGMSREVFVICVVGNPGVKKRLIERALVKGRMFATLVHPEVSCASSVILGEGVLISKGCILTKDIVIGSHVSINPGCGIGHDTIINDFCTLMWHVNISGAVVVEEGCLLGTKATVLQGKRIGKWTTIGAGAVVTDDLPPYCTAVGVPARVIKYSLGEQK